MSFPHVPSPDNADPDPDHKRPLASACADISDTTILLLQGRRTNLVINSHRTDRLNMTEAFARAKALKRSYVFGQRVDSYEGWTAKDRA